MVASCVMRKVGYVRSWSIKIARLQQVTIGECNSGFYCFDKEFLLTALDEVSTQNVQGEYYLTDVLALAYQAGRAIGCLRAEDPLECMGVNSRSQLAEASACLQARINTAHMENGVTIIDPATTWIGPDVNIAPDTEIWPMSFLFGSTRVGSDCVVGPHSRAWSIRLWGMAHARRDDRTRIAHR